MQELFNVAILTLNLPFTILLVLVVIYWISVIVGAMDLSFLDFDLDVETDADVDVETDVSISSTAGLHLKLLRFVNLAYIPLMVIVSIFVVSLWIGAILGNYYFNPGMSPLIGLVIFIANFIIAVIVTKILTTPLKPLFKSLNHAASKTEIIGTLCTLKYNLEVGRMGQAEVEIGGAPVLINVKIEKDPKMEKGDKALVIMESENKEYYIIEEFKEWEN